MATTFHKEMPLGEWVLMFREIYYPTQNYGRSANAIFTHLVKVFGAGSHFLFRTHDPSGSKEYLAKLFAWYCALANRLELDIEDALWEKYPGVCPRCLLPVCRCSETPNKIDAEKLSMIALENAYQRPKSLREWQVLFARIYKGPSGGADVPPTRERLALIFARMAEELGEVAEGLGLDGAVDPDAKLVLKNEMADFGAWIFSLANNLQYVDPAAQGATLADVAWQQYPGKCTRCSEAKCLCVKGTYALELAEKGAMAPSHWDERTGLANDKALRRYLAYADSIFQEDFRWSLIFLDLDDFGQVNKTYSHPIGDEVLRLAAQRIVKYVGRRGIPFRRGGEEFVVVLRDLEDVALRIAENIRRSLNEEPITIGTNEIRVTASIGVASIVGSKVKRPSELEAVAESYEQRAKRAGKNRVESTPD